MTGFGSAENNGCRVEIRSLNHRFLDIYVKVPVFLSHLEMELRNLLKERFSRGKLDVSVFVPQAADSGLEVNRVFAGNIYSALKKLQEEYSIPGTLDINSLTNLRDIFSETQPSYDVDLILAVFKQAMENLYEMRKTEGIQLARGLYQMLDALAAMTAEVRSLSSRVIADLTGKFNERIASLLAGKEIDSSRMLQEAAIIASKLDVSEEITRIESHLRQFREILGNGDIIGRKLDFILQELNREVNTIASKSNDYAISNLTVEMKTVIEQVREQVQNIQ